MTDFTRSNSSYPTSWKGAPTGNCTYCDIAPATTWDHVVPRALGGSDRDSNLVPACGYCNRSKNSKSVDRWLEMITSRVDFDGSSCNGTCACCGYLAKHPHRRPSPPHARLVSVRNRWAAIYSVAGRAMRGEGLFSGVD